MTSSTVRSMPVWERRTEGCFSIRSLQKCMTGRIRYAGTRRCLKPYLYASYKYLSLEEYHILITKHEDYMRINAEMRREIDDVKNGLQVEPDEELLEKWKRQAFAGVTVDREEYPVIEYNGTLLWHSDSLVEKKSDTGSAVVGGKI